jgi:hypothetical protein
VSDPGTESSDAGARPDQPDSGQTGTVAVTTVEHVVRAKLAEALGGPRGIVESAVPTIAFTLSYLISAHDLRLSLTIAVALAVLLLVARVVQRQPVQFVVNSLVGIGIAAVFAARSGKAEDVYLPGILYNAGYAVVMIASVLVRWPVVGLIIGSVTGDVSAWRQDPAIVRLCGRLTWVLVAPCVIRVAVQWPLYVAGHVGWLGATKIALGWPLQVGALSLMAYLLARGRTPARVPAAHAVTTD